MAIAMNCVNPKTYEHFNGVFRTGDKKFTPLDVLFPEMSKIVRKEQNMPPLFKDPYVCYYA